MYGSPEWLRCQESRRKNDTQGWHRWHVCKRGSGGTGGVDSLFGTNQNANAGICKFVYIFSKPLSPAGKRDIAPTHARSLPRPSEALHRGTVFGVGVDVHDRRRRCNSEKHPPATNPGPMGWTTVGKGLTCSPVFFTVTSLPTVMKMNVHADAENPLWRAVRGRGRRRACVGAMSRSP